MLIKVFLVATIVAATSASIPIISSSLSLPQRLTAIQGAISHSECVPCEEAMSTAIHTGADSAWMGAWMDKICPYLNEKYGWSWQLCDIAAYLIMNDIGNHLQPDAVYNCEQIGICPKLPPGAAQIVSANSTETATGLVKVKLVVNVSKPTAAGSVELKLLCPPNVGDGIDVILPKYNAGLPAGISVIDYEFTADQSTFSCDDSCPGTYNMKLSVCELECDDSKHAGHAVLDVDDSLTFEIRD